MSGAKEANVKLEEKKLALRIKSKKSQNAVLRDVSTKQSIQEFLHLLSTTTGVPEDRIVLLTGFPPKRLDFNKSTPLETLGLLNQDTLIVEEDEVAHKNSNKPTVKYEPDTVEESVNHIAPSFSETEIWPVGGHPPRRYPPTDLSPSTSRTTFGDAGVDVPGSYAAVSSSVTVKDQLIINALNSSTKKELDTKTSGDAGLGSSSSSSGPSELSRVLTSGAQNHSERSRSLFATDSESAETIVNQFRNPHTASDIPDPAVMFGMMLRQIVPADNSCLFTSISFCLSGNLSDNIGASHMRELIAATVASDPERFNEAMLGRPNAEYVTWIMKNESWGGGIELSILSDFYGMEISVVDIQSLHVSKFGEDKNFPKRMVLLYDGIHYDPLYIDLFDGTNPVTQFHTSDATILDRAIQLGREAKAAHQFTDLSNFSLKCGICNTLLKGQTEAQAHAKTTGHTNFSEIVS